MTLMEAYQVNITVVSSRNDKHAWSCWEGSIQETKSTQVRRLSEVVAGVCYVYRLPDDERQHQSID